MKSPLIETALTLSGSRLNPLVLMSDPLRTPNLLTLVEKLPESSAVIYRHFGQSGLEADLRQLTSTRSIQLLIGNDPDLAETCQADGVHFSRTVKQDEIRLWRSRYPDWIISVAASKPPVIPSYVEQLDALFVSSIFPSNSPSAGKPIGIKALRTFARDCPCPVFALGGITDANISILAQSNIAGIGAIEGLIEALEKPQKTPMTQTSPNPKPSVSVHKEETADLITFIAQVEGVSETGKLTLRRISDTVWNANHTGVPRAIGGRGVGKALVQAMVEDARQSGYKVVPGCPFVAKLFERHPDWAEGVAA